MIAIDTNLIIRYLLGDDQQQSHRARELINSGTVFVPITVMLEVEWVLRSIYRMSRVNCVDAIRGFAGLPTVVIDDAAIISEALDLFSHGMDFADALHLLKAQHCEKFVTFDRQMIKAAQAAGHQFVQDA
jgi:predicted nucleic-acid-binding protein